MGYTKQQRAEKALMSTGVGESKIFCDPNAPDPNAFLRTCHIEGKLIGENYTDEQIAALRYAWTDEGIAENNLGKSKTRIEVGPDPLSKQMQKRKDDVLDRGMETWEAENPMKEIVERHGRPGFKQRFLSDQTVKNRGMRGWQPVVVDGQPVTLGNLKLAEMPEEKAEVRNKHYREQASKKLEQVQTEYIGSGGRTAVADQ